MADHALKSNEVKVSEFITGTCQLLPKSYTPTADKVHDLTMSLSPAPSEDYILTGSTAEFYIRPLNTCIGDFDFLLCTPDLLACIGDLPMLPSDRTGLADAIRCYQFQPYKGYPGFVRIRELGEMNYNWKHKWYEFKPTIDPGIYMTIKRDKHDDSNLDQGLRDLYKRSTLSRTVNGPAVKSQIDSDVHLAFDSVISLFCPHWPREAMEWSIRSRKYGWPTNDTISEVVQYGCHAVYVQHRSCRYDISQWRLSFSVAEVVLLRSWTQTQQIVYHLLRFFAKRELIQKDCPKEDEVLCPYHLKTLMLWTCEEMPAEWWNSSSIIAICCELLKILSEWLHRTHCPNYFIPEANLFHESLISEKLLHIRRRLDEFHNSGTLSNWFLENYILPIIEAQFQFLSTRKVKPDFMDYMAPLLGYRKAFELHSLDFVFSLKLPISNHIGRHIIKRGLSLGLFRGLKVEHCATTEGLNSKMHSAMAHLPITKKNLCLIHYDNLLCALYIAYGLRYEEISWDSNSLVEFIKAIFKQPKTIRSRYHNFPNTYLRQSSRFLFQCAQDFMKNAIGSNCNSFSELQLVSLMSKDFLKEALEYEDCKSNGIAPAALAYLAALHFATSEYNQAIRYCLAVFLHHTSEKDKETLNAGCLLFIDGVARIVGLCVLHQKITGNNLHYIGKWLYLDLRLSPKVFAHYLAVVSAERMSKYFDLQHTLTDSVLLMDKYLESSIKPKCIEAMCKNLNATRQIAYRTADSMKDSDGIALNSHSKSIVKETLINVLLEYGQENMALFYRAINTDFGIQFNTADCYRASYLYKNGKYDEALHLCKQILHEPDLEGDLKEFSLTNVLLIPPLDLFFDEDVQSLLGFHTLVYFVSPHNDDKQKLTFEQWFASKVRFYGFDFSAYIPQSYSVRCNFFLGRYFLARYLKVRCCIDCGLPYAEAMTKFTAQKIYFPFEHIIRRYLQLKLRRNLL